ncbi:abortive infection family protein [Bartonella sp. B17]
MSNLNFLERQKFERLFKMGDGFVLDFTNCTYAAFFNEYGVDIYASRYSKHGTSKAKRMRAFWDIDSDCVVGRVMDGLIAFGVEQNWIDNKDIKLILDCQKTSYRLQNSQQSDGLSVLSTFCKVKNFKIAIQHINDSIYRDQPEAALDRLHTCLCIFIREKCKKYGIKVAVDKNNNKPLHSLYGEYVKVLDKALSKDGYLKSEMTESIIKSTIRLMQDFNKVRNNNTLAHPNLLLSYEEGLLILNYISITMQFINSLEKKIQVLDNSGAEQNALSSDVPF